MPSKAKARTITLTETELPDSDRELLDCWLAAKRAERQAQVIIEKLGVHVLVLARKHPALLYAGGRITVGRNTTYAYSRETLRQMEDLAALLAEERGNGRAIATTTEHPQLRELSKFAAQPVVTGRAGIFRSLFGSGA